MSRRYYRGEQLHPVKGTCFVGNEKQGRGFDRHWRERAPVEGALLNFSGVADPDPSQTYFAVPLSGSAAHGFFQT